MTPALSIAAAQTIPCRGDVAANLAQHVELAAAAAPHARVVVFPELSLTGYEPDLAAGLAFVEDDPRLAPLREAAGDLGVMLVAGAPVRLASGLHIGAFVVGPGRVALYTKHHLGGDEPAVFVPGDRDPRVTLSGWAAALAVCADANHPSHAAAAATRGAGGYLVGAFVTPEGMASKTARLSGYAQQHSMAVLFANFGAPSGGLASGGGSAVWAPGGARLAALPASGAGLVLAWAGPDGWTGRAVASPGSS